jgi:hypothetical protein
MRTTIISLLAFIIFPSNVYAQDKDCDLECRYKTLQKLYNKLKKENQKLKKENDTLKPITIKQLPKKIRKFRNSLDGVIDKEDFSKSSSQYNDVVKSAQKYWKLYKAIVHEYNNFVSRYNTRLHVKNHLAKKLDFYLTQFRKKRNYIAQLYMRNGEERPLRFALKSKYVPYVDNSYMERHKMYNKAVPQLTKDKRVGNDSHDYAVRFEDTIYKLYNQLKKEMEENKIEHDEHLGAIKDFKKKIPIWKKHYEDILKLEIHVKNPSVRKTLALCKIAHCDKPKILDIR